MFQLHAWRLLDPFFTRMAPDDIAFIADVMADWQQSALVNEKACQWFWYDMATGIRASKLAALITGCHAQAISLPLPPPVLDWLVNQHIKWLTDPNELNPGNHGLAQLQGLMSLLFSLEQTGRAVPQQAQATRFAHEKLHELLASQLGPCGIHTEDSPDYHFFALARIRDILNAPWWDATALAESRKTFRKAQRAQYWLVTPDMRCPPVGDSAEGVKRVDPGRLAAWPHTIQGTSMAAQLDGYGVVRSQPDVPLEQSHYLFFQGSFRSQAHKHADCLSFVWQEGGRYLLWDSGKYGYQADNWRDYFLSTRAHNTVEIDGRDFTRRKSDAYGSAMQKLVPCDDGWLLVAHVQHKNLQAGHQRVVFYRPGIGVDVLDMVRNTARQSRLSALARRKTRHYRWWWHFGPHAQPDTVSPGYVRVTSSDGLAMTVDARSTVPGTPETHPYYGEKEPRLAGWFSPGYLQTRPSHAVSFDVHSDAEQFAVVTRFRLAGHESVRSVFTVTNNQPVGNNQPARNQTVAAKKPASGGKACVATTPAILEALHDVCKFPLSVASRSTPATARPEWRGKSPTSTNRYALITVDTEALPKRATDDHVNRLIWGRHARGTAGIAEMCAIGNEFGAKHVFFVDMCGAYKQLDQTLEVVRWLDAQGQDVQLHTHPEYLPKAFWEQYGLPFQPRYMNRYTDDARAEFIFRHFGGLMSKVTGKPVLAHRAGSFRWNAASIRALEAAGIPLSFNNSMLAVHNKQCVYSEPTNHPFEWSNGVIEVPTTEKHMFTRMFGDEWWVRLTYPASPFFQYRPWWGSLLLNTFSDNPPFAVFLLHSWSLLYWDEQGHAEYRDDHRLEGYRKLLSRVSKDYDIITAPEFLALYKDGIITPTHEADLSLAEYRPPVRKKRSPAKRR